MAPIQTLDKALHEKPRYSLSEILPPPRFYIARVKGGLSSTDQQKLMNVIGDVLNSQSLGGNTAGRIDEEHFSIIHDKNTDVSEVGQKIERAASEVDPSAAQLSSETTTVDANAKGDSSPFQLITLAEEIGVIAEFDLAVTQKAVQVVVQRAVKGDLKPLAVNVSGHSIQNKDFIKDLHEMLRQAQNINRGIMFEITESSEIRDLDAVNATIQEFRTRGFHFALDDFGAGAANFDYLNSFDVDTVKFDGPVVKRAYATEKGKAFLASMATLCNNTGVETIAEMVEDEPLASFLTECGIHLGQGYYFGRPEPDPMVFNELLRGK